MILLLRSEIRRALSRRLTRVLILLASAGVAALAVGFFVNSERGTANEFRLVQLWLTQAEAARRGVQRDGTLGFTTGLFVMMGVVGGASFIGAEYRAGTITTLLTWEPRRLRVLVTKLAAAALVAAAVYLVVQAVLVAALALVAQARGSTAGADTAFWTGLAGFLARGAVLTAAAVLVGACIATIGRNTSAALGVCFGYLIAVESILRGLRPGWVQWFLVENALAFASGESVHLADQTISALHGTWVLGVALGALVTAALVVFRRRDVT